MNEYDALRKYLMRPALYAKTEAKFWNNPHIEKHMLATHLDSSTDRASRKPEFIDRSVEWIMSLPLPPDACLLDIGCGPGLYTKRFSKRGLRVAGLDFSQTSLDYARKADAKSQYILGDYLAMDFEDAFDIVTLIWCDYGALVPEDRKNLLRRVRRALKPGGLFLLDVFTPQYIVGKNETTSWEHNASGGFWSAKPHIALEAFYLYDETATLIRCVVVEENCVRDFNIWNCLFTQPALFAEAATNGFALEGFWGDIAGAPYTESAQTLCGLFQKKP